MKLNWLNHQVKKKGRQSLTYFLLPILLLLGGISGAFAQDIVLKDANTTVTEGSNFTITAELQNGSVTVSGVELHLVFDPVFLEVVSIDPISSSFFPIVPDSFDNAAGTLVYFGGGFPPFPSGTFEFVNIEFLAKAQGSTTIAYSQTNPTIVTGTVSGGGNIAQALNPANVSIAPLSCPQALTAQTPELCADEATSFDLTSLEASITTQAGTFAYSSGGTAINTPSAVSVSNGQVIDVDFTGNDGCQASTTITFDVASALTGANFQVSDATCNLDNGSITLIGGQGGLSGGVAPYSFSLDGSDYSNTSGIFSNLSPNTYTFYIQDARGCLTTQNVLVQDEADITAPTVACALDFTLFLSANGTASISAQDIDNGSTDNCGIASISIDKTDFSCADEGPNVVTLTVTDNAGNSATCSTIVTVDASNAVDATQVTASTCDPAQVGVASQTLTNQFGCDSVVITTTTLLPSDTTQVVATTCDPAQVGVSSQTLTNQFGCDSVIITTTTLLPNDEVTISEEICQGDSFDFNGQIISTSGNFQQTLTNQFGCDSVVNLNLTLIQTITTNEIIRICEGDTITFGNLQLSAAGIFSQTFTSAAGCDSVVNLALFVDPVKTTTLTETICANETFSFSGEVLSLAGTYMDTLSTSAGCDSIVTLNLNVDPVDSTFLDLLTCDANQVGIASVTLTNQFGCDSVVTTNTVLDTIVPTAVCQNVFIDLDAQGQASITAAQVDNGSFDNCGIASLQLSQTDFTCADVGVVPVVLTVTDNAGNTASCTADINVTASDPLACLSVKLEGDSLIGVNGNNIIVPFTVKDFNTITGGQGSINWDTNVLTFVGSTTNATVTSLLINSPVAGQATYSFFDANLLGFTLADGDTLFTLEFQVIGAQGTSSALALTDNPIVQEYFRAPVNAIDVQLINGFVDVPFDAPLSGVAKTEIGTIIPGVTFNLGGFNGPQSQVGTPGYSFLVTPGTDAEVGAYKNNDVDRDNGVSVLDILLTSLDITGVQSLSSPYKKIAADVNYSGSLSSLDLLLMQFFIVQVNPGFPDPSNPPAIDRLWTFLPSDFVFADPNDPVPFDSSRTYDFVLGGINQDFIGVKLGDVDNSWNSAVLRTDNNDPVYFEMDNVQVQPGQEFVVPVKVREFDEIAGYQYTMEWDAEVLELVGVEQSALQGVFGMNEKENGRISVLWSEPGAQGIELPDGSEAFSLRFRAKSGSGMKTIISFNGGLTPMEAYTGALNPRHIVGVQSKVQVGNVTTSVDLSSELSYSLKPQPNPFTEHIAFNITLPSQVEVRIEVLNSLGQSVKRFTRTLDAGEHQIDWDGRGENGEMISEGIYYVRMRTADHDQVISIRKQY